jgi:extracellular factor (EF) 3-hydroxypalmitic acid methyl ester biosynthesis protein
MLTHNGVAEAQTKDVLAVFQSNHGMEVCAKVHSFIGDTITFEISGSEIVFQLSEVLNDFRVFVDHQQVYGGKATITGLKESGSLVICDATLRGSVLELDLSQLDEPEKFLRAGFSAFLSRWQGFYQILPEYKLAVADMQSFLKELGLWLQQIELGIRAHPSGNRLEMERALVGELFKVTTPAISTMFERFERIAEVVPAELVPVHRAFCHQELHPLLLCSPFMHRIYMKPLGYAGDYEMVNMILRNPCEGSSLLAKLLNVFILAQDPAEAHRNRVTYLTERLVQETLRVSRLGRSCRFYSIGCGPAGEVQRFLTQHEISRHAQFTLLDMNDETLQFVGKTLTEIKKLHNRPTPITLVKNSVRQLLKQSSSPKSELQKFDFIYAAGLFDYLNDQICKTLISLTYEMLAPGGALLVTNVHSGNPIRNIMEHIYEWHLIYRTSDQFVTLTSELPPDAVVTITAEATSSNVIIEVRKPQCPT